MTPHNPFRSSINDNSAPSELDMHSTPIWSRIGTKLYLALAFAVTLTILSAAVGIYHFEQSGDLNHQVENAALPLLEDTRYAATAAMQIVQIGHDLQAEATASKAESDSTHNLSAALELMQASLARPAGHPNLNGTASSVHQAAADTAHDIDRIELERLYAAETAETRRTTEAFLNGHEWTDIQARAALIMLQALAARNTQQLDHYWNQYAAIAKQPKLDPALRSLAESDNVSPFVIRQREFESIDRISQLNQSFDQHSDAMVEFANSLMEQAATQATADVSKAVAGFDQGRITLAGISIASVILATMVAWIWVGNGIIKRLSRLSRRMRAMADGDLETPVPEVGRDEIGQLADSLEVFRQNALEVQRLNLVEQLFEELRQAHNELSRMQVRLVAQEKLAGLGQLVSGVAHEISNPLNFIKNFSEAAGELADELFEMLDPYSDTLDDDDATLFTEIKGDMKESIGRIKNNGNRALAIISRMQALGTVGGAPSPTDLNQTLRQAVNIGCDTFHHEWQDFQITPEFDLSPQVHTVHIVPNDFNEAIINLVTNACYSLRLRTRQEPDNYQPILHISTSPDQEPGMVNIKVLDNGTGVAEDIKDKIFDPFFTTRDGALGAGLGLPRAADVARRCGGDLTMTSTPGQSALFTMTVPVDMPKTTIDSTTSSDEGSAPHIPEHVIA